MVWVILFTVFCLGGLVGNLLTWAVKSGEEKRQYNRGYDDGYSDAMRKIRAREREENDRII